MSKDWRKKNRIKARDYAREYARKLLLRPGYRAEKNKAMALARKLRKKNSPIRYKAQTLMSGLGWGKGGADKMQKVVEDSLGKKCKYCAVELNIGNLSLDHKMPVARGGTNDITNTHIVCKICNRSKSNLTDEEYTKLLEFLNQQGDPMKKIILSKMKVSNFMFRA